MVISLNLPVKFGLNVDGVPITREGDLDISRH